MILERTANQSTTKTARPQSTKVSVGHETIQELAYQLWVLRARPVGSPEVDWYRAEAELKDAMRTVNPAS
jgi:hypothetical protein